MKKGIQFTTKQMTLAERTECNDLETEFNPNKGTVITKDMFAQRVKYLKYGLFKLGDVEITDDNFDSLVLQLTTDEIVEIADKIADETNFPKKKNSK